MDFNKINWFAFLPSLFAIYLLSISGLASGYLAVQVKRAIVDRGAAGHEDFVRNVASGWAAQLGFVNAVLASIFSAFSIWSTSRSYEGITWTVVVLLIVFVTMLWYVFRHEPDEIVSTTSKRLGITPAMTCKIVLTFINVLLIIAIAVSQQWTPTK